MRLFSCKQSLSDPTSTAIICYTMTKEAERESGDTSKPMELPEGRAADKNNGNSGDDSDKMKVVDEDGGATQSTASKENIISAKVVLEARQQEEELEKANSVHNIESESSHLDHQNAMANTATNLQCVNEELPEWEEDKEKESAAPVSPTTITTVDRIEYLLRRKEGYDPKPLTYYQQQLMIKEEIFEDSDEQQEALEIKKQQQQEEAIIIVNEDEEENEKDDYYHYKQRQKTITRPGVAGTTTTTTQTQNISASDLFCKEELKPLSLSSTNENSIKLSLPNDKIIEDLERKRQWEKDWSKYYESFRVPGGKKPLKHVEPNYLTDKTYDSILDNIEAQQVREYAQLQQWEQQRSKKQRLDLSIADREFLNEYGPILRYSWEGKGIDPSSSSSSSPGVNVSANNPIIGSHAYNAVLQAEADIVAAVQKSPFSPYDNNRSSSPAATADATAKTRVASRKQVHQIIQGMPRPRTIRNPPEMDQLLDQYLASSEVMDYEMFVLKLEHQRREQQQEITTSKHQKVNGKTKEGDGNDDTKNNNTEQKRQPWNSKVAADNNDIQASNSNINPNSEQQQPQAQKKQSGRLGRKINAMAVAAAAAINPFQTIGQLYAEFSHQDNGGGDDDHELSGSNTRGYYESFTTNMNHMTPQGLQEYMRNLNQQSLELKRKQKDVIEKSTKTGIINQEVWTDAFQQLGTIIDDPRKLSSQHTKTTKNDNASSVSTDAAPAGVSSESR